MATTVGPMTVIRLRYALAAGLLLVTACDGDRSSPSGPRGEGVLLVTTLTTGVDLDDRYVVTVHGFLSGSLWIGPNASYHWRLPAGPITVDLGDVANNCALSDSSDLSLSVPVADTVRATFHVQCTATARVEVRVSTAGSDRDVNGYFVVLDDDNLGGAPITDFIAFVKVPPGTHRLTLLGIAPNCTADPDSAQSGAAAGGDTLRISWTVSCALTTDRRMLFWDSGDIYVRGPGTGLLVNVTNDAARDTLATWSPDGTSIAFASNRSGDEEIHLVRRDGSGMTNLTNSPAAESDPAWSPDGTWIAFVSDRDGNREIYVMNADGSGQTRLTSDLAPDNFPGWSPDGTRIAFVRGCLTAACTPRADVYVMNADGSGVTALTSGRGVVNRPMWSPDGARIAYVGEHDGSWWLSVRSTEGAVEVTLANGPDLPDSPTWSPDGTRIAFASRLGGPFGIYVAKLDGSDLQRIAWGAYPAWSPDGTRIAGVFSICGNYSGPCELFVVNPDGTGLVPLTNGHNAQSPVWSPR